MYEHIDGRQFERHIAERLNVNLDLFTLFSKYV